MKQYSDQKNNLKSGNAHQGGFTLLEMLLSVMIFGGLLLAIFQVIDSLGRKELARSTASYMERVSEAVEDTLSSDINNFAGFYNDILLDQPTCTAVAGFLCSRQYDIALFINGGLVGATSPVNIPPSSILNTNFRTRNPLRSDMAVVMSIADDPANPNDIQSLNVLVVSLARAPDEYVRESASEAGPSGGWFRTSSAPLALNDQIIGAYGTWQINIGQYVGTPWYNAVGANLPDADNGGTYLVHRLYMNYNDTSGDYLYRRRQTNPELHRMLSALNLGGNNIVGADNVVTRRDITVNSQVIVQGAAHIGGNLSVLGSLYGDARAEARGNINLNNGTAGDVGFINEATFQDPAFNLGGTNNVLSQGNVTINTLNVTAGGQIDAVNGEFQNVTIPDLDVARLGGAGGTAVVLGAVTAQPGSSVNVTSLRVATGSTVDITEGLEASQLDFSTGSTLSIPGEAVGALQINTEAQTNVGGTVEAPQITVRTLNVNNFGLCDVGCGN